MNLLVYMNCCLNSLCFLIYWYKKYYMNGSPKLSVLLMIDGSGSMSGARRNAAVQACVILHEVLQSKNIEHAIVEHRAIYEKPLVDHNILFGFSDSDKKKYNIMRLSADDGTREGLSLFWAEGYINKFSTSENRIILVISDGYPQHSCGSSEYYPPVSVRDTANAADKISRRGTNIIAIALGAGCYDDLKGIYPKTVLCDDLDKLTGKLLKQIADVLGKDTN